MSVDKAVRREFAEAVANRQPYKVARLAKSHPTLLRSKKDRDLYQSPRKLKKLWTNSN